jgi:WD40 repeat protein
MRHIVLMAVILALAIAVAARVPQASVLAGGASLPIAAPTAFGNYTLDVNAHTITPLGSVSRSIDDTKLAEGTGGSTGGLRILDLRTGSTTLVPGTDAHFSGILPDGRVIPTPFPNYLATGVKWSPTGDSLAFIGTPPGDAVLPGLVVWRLGSPQTRMLATGGIQHIGSYAWTPDGRELTVLLGMQSDTGPEQVAVNFDPLTGESTTLLKSPAPGAFESIAWSSDGAYLALAGATQSGCTSTNSQTGLWTWEAATGSLQQLFDGGHTSFKWDGDRGLLAGVCQAEPSVPVRHARYALQRFAADGSTAAVLAADLAVPLPAYSDAAFDSANGAIIYTDRDCDSGAASAWMLAPGADEPGQISDPTSLMYEARLSPDGSEVAALVRVTGGVNLVLISAGGKSETILSTDRSLTKLSWSPGGHWLNFEVTRAGFWDC